MMLEIAKIRLNGGTQPRKSINEGTVNEYRQDMLAGAEFPPVTVFHDGFDYWLADGFHRVLASQSLGNKEIKADVKQGDRRDAVLYSAGANTSHGLRRTNADKRRAVMMLLNDPEWSQWSDREIGRRCNVDHTFVGKLRQAHTGADTSMKPTERTFTHHKTGKPAVMNTSNIGKSKPEDSAVANVPEFEQSPIIGVFGDDDDDDCIEFEPSPDSIGSVHHADCLEFMGGLESGSVQLVVTSPPYPGQRGNDMTVTEWYAWIRPIISEIGRILHPETGVLAFNVMFPRFMGQFGGGVLDIPMMLTVSGGLSFIDMYIWHKTNPVPAGNLKRHDIPAWEPVYVAAKSQNYTFNPVYDHYAQKSINKLLPQNKARAAGVAGGYSNGHSKMAAQGARQTNVLSLSSSGENRPRALGGSFPLALAERFVKQYSNPGDLVFDPFCGAGTVLKAAQDNGRTWIGCDIDNDEVDKARGWLSE